MSEPQEFGEFGTVDAAKAEAPKPTLRRRLWRCAYDRGWSRGKLIGSFRHRILDVLGQRHPWWDWGHPLMTLVGQEWCGSWREPVPPTWWYRLGKPKRMVKTGYPQHPLSTYEIITSYKEFQARTVGLNEDEMYEWQAICVDSDGSLQLGHRYWGGTFYGLSHWDVALLRKYLRMWRRLDWWGLRSWIYKQALNAAVDRKKPFACNAVPPRGHGGYSHWHCTLKRRHGGLHRFRDSYWGDMDGHPLPVTHAKVGR
jgi:hypothetical protein